MMKHLFILPVLLILSACGTSSDNEISRREAPIDQRVSILELQKNLEPASADLLSDEMSLPPIWNNSFWPQAGGYPNHAMGHVAFTSDQAEQLWSTSIGRGSNDEIPLNSSPIIVDGKIFTLDIRNDLTAFNIENGDKLWSQNISNDKKDDPVITGGIAFSDGVIYATNGYNQTLAVSAENGEIFWRKALPAPARTAPTILDNRVFISSVDNRLTALDARDGSVLWDHVGLAESASLVGGASPAATSDIVVPAFSSGEILALQVENGAVAWSDNLAGLKRGGGLSSISGIKAMPVIDKDIVVAISFNGMLAAIDQRTGRRIWQRDISGSETPWVAENTVFIVTNDAELVALQADNGIIRWVSQLPRFKDEEDREGPIVWMGPVLAGERLIIAGSNGTIKEMDPLDGAELRSWDADRSIAFTPVFANGVMYILSNSGTLKAYQ